MEIKQVKSFSDEKEKLEDKDKVELIVPKEPIVEPIKKEGMIVTCIVR